MKKNSDGYDYNEMIENYGTVISLGQYSFHATYDPVGYHSYMLDTNENIELFPPAGSQLSNQKWELSIDPRNGLDIQSDNMDDQFIQQSIAMLDQYLNKSARKAKKMKKSLFNDGKEFEYNGQRVAFALDREMNTYSPSWIDADGIGQLDRNYFVNPEDIGNEEKLEYALSHSYADRFKSKAKAMRKETKTEIADDDIVEVEEEGGKKVVEVESKEEHEEVASGEESESDNLNAGAKKMKKSNELLEAMQMVAQDMAYVESVVEQYGGTEVYEKWKQFDDVAWPVTESFINYLSTIYKMTKKSRMIKELDALEEEPVADDEKHGCGCKGQRKWFAKEEEPEESEEQPKGEIMSDKGYIRRERRLKAMRKAGDEEKDPLLTDVQDAESDGKGSDIADEEKNRVEEDVADGEEMGEGFDIADEEKSPVEDDVDAPKASRKNVHKFSVTTGGGQRYDGREKYDLNPMMRECVDREFGNKDLVKSLNDRIDALNGQSRDSTRNKLGNRKIRY